MVIIYHSIIIKQIIYLIIVSSPKFGKQDKYIIDGNHVYNIYIMYYIYIIYNGSTYNISVITKYINKIHNIEYIYDTIYYV